MTFDLVDKLVEKALSPLSERATEIIIGRYGLENKDQRTLAELGNRYGLTRERVRQIEFHALNRMKEQIIDLKETVRLLELIHNYLDKIGNLRRSDMLVKDLKVLCEIEQSESLFSNQLHLLADVVGEPEVIEDDYDWHSLWHNDQKAYKLAQKIVFHLLTTKEHNFDSFLESITNRFGLLESLVLNYVSISKHFGIGPYGDLGARHWIHINPKTVRDKSYLILKKAGTPLHFKEVANRINNLKEVKQVCHQTVHNELIKDSRFILVGRGIYALKK